MTDAHLTIRDYRDDDAAAIRACVVELHEYERRLDPRLRPGEAMAAAYLQSMLRRCRESSGTILVVELEGSVAGFITILTHVAFTEVDEPPGAYALVSDLVVRENHRRRGVGAALMREAESRARAAGAAELRVAVLSGNEPAAHLYRNTGFTPYLVTLAKSLEKPAT